MRVTVDDGVGLEVRVEGGGPGLMLVHGFGGAKEDFDDHVEVLAGSHTVVTFDHRGHGESDKPHDHETYTIDRLRSDTLAIADAVGFDSFRLLGHSMGGMVVRGIAVRHPHRVEALVLMDTSHGPIPGFDPKLMDLAAEIALTQGKDVLKQVLDEAAPLDNPAHQRVLDARPGYKEFGERKWADLSERMWAGLAVEIAYQEDELEALAGVQCPTLVLVGELDKPFRGSSRRMSERIPGARLAIVPSAGHSPQFENPDVWIAEMLDFLGRVPGAGQAPSVDGGGRDAREARSA